MQSQNKIPEQLEDLRYRIRSSINQNKIKLGKFILLQRLGGGNYGDVYKAIHQDNQKYFAIKIIDKKLLFQKNKDQYVRQVLKRLLDTEGVLMQMCESPYVVKCYDIMENPRFKIFVLEYCNRASLHEELKKRKAFPVNQALAIIKQIIMGLSELHKNKIIHRDLKAENIMISNGKYKIADFGFSRKIDNQNSVSNYTVLGTRTTMAPQVKNRQKYGIKADIWSIGIIFYTMICSNIPFEAEGGTGRSNDINTQVKKGNNLFFNTIQGKPDDQLKDFIKSMLTIDQKKRISWRQLISHKIFKRGMQGLQQNPVQNVDLQNADYTVVVSQAKLQEHEDLLFKEQKLKKKESRQPKQKDVQSQIRKQLNETITLQIEHIDDIQDFRKKIKSDLDQVLYKQITLNNLQCHKAQYIYQKIILELIKKKMFDFSRKSHNQLMYLMITRCFTNVSWADNNLKVNANDEMLISYHSQVKELYTKIKVKWSKIEQNLFEISDSLFYKLVDFKDKIVSKQKSKNVNIFFGGIQKLDYTKEKQIQYTQNEYIQKLIEQLKGEPNQVYEMKLKLQSYKKINQITLEDLQKRGVTFFERVKQIIVPN